MFDFSNTLTLSKRLSDRYVGHQAIQNIFHPETCRLRDKYVRKMRFFSDLIFHSDLNSCVKLFFSMIQLIMD